MDASGIVIHDDSEATCMLGLLQLIRLFDAIDEDFLRCWNGQCKNDYGGCRFLREQTAVRIYEQINRHDPLAAAENKSAPGFSNMMGSSPGDSTHSGQQHRAFPCQAGNSSAPGSAQQSSVPSWLSSAKLTSSQEADILINQQWLQNRLWHLCLSHKLLVPQSEHAALCIYNAITIAENTLRICQKMPLNSIEAHGIGLVEKLYCIVESAIAAIRHRAAIGDWGDGANEMDVSEDGADTPGTTGASGRNDDADRYSQYGGSERGVGEQLPPHPRRVECYRPLLLGFSDLFKTIRAGDHMFLERFNALAGQDFGL